MFGEFFIYLNFKIKLDIFIFCLYAMVKLYYKLIINVRRREPPLVKAETLKVC